MCARMEMGGMDGVGCIVVGVMMYGIGVKERLI